MTTRTAAGDTAIHAKRARLRPGLVQTGVTALIAASALPAQAGSTAGSITFSPADVAAVPTLGGSLLVLLAGLLALIAIKAYRRADGGIAPMVAGLLALGSLASAGGGFDLIRQAQAATPTEITNPEGEQLPLGFGTTVFLNSAGVPMEVTELSLESCSIEPSQSETPDCSEGTVVAEEEQCQVNLLCPV